MSREGKVEIMSREDDATVAEILGWKFYVQDPAYINASNEPRLAHPAEITRYDIETTRPLQFRVNADVPDFTTDPSADYMVLEWVMKHDRENDNTYALFGSFSMSLLDIWQPCSYMPEADIVSALFYQPGDYSRALLALKEKGLL